MAQEVQIYFKSYREFVNCENDRLKVIISALNIANIGCYNDLRIKYPGSMLEPPPVDINKLVQVIQNVCPAQVVQYLLDALKKDEVKASDVVPTGNKDVNNVGLFPPKGKDQVGLFPPNSSPKNHNKSNEHLRNFNLDQSVEEVNEQGSYQPPDRHDVNRRHRSRSPETSTPRERHRYDVTDRRYRYDGYLNRSDSNYSDQLTLSQWMEAKLFLDKYTYFDGSNNKEALNYLAQCEEAAQKMKAPETTVAWSKLSGRADVVMIEESKQQEGTVTWEVFQSMLIEHFYHIPRKKRAAELLNKLQQDPHESKGEYVQRGSKIIQVCSGKTNLRDLSASQYGWNIVQGLTNISIKNKIADHIANCHSLLDVCKLIRQVRREMENREAFTGISAEPEESIDEVNWRQNNYNQGGRRYSNRGSNRGSYRGNQYPPSSAARGRGYNTYGNNNPGSNGYMKKAGTLCNPDVRYLWFKGS